MLSSEHNLFFYNKLDKTLMPWQWQIALVLYFNLITLMFKSSQVKSALLSILPHVQYIHTEN